MRVPFPGARAASLSGGGSAGGAMFSSHAEFPGCPGIVVKYRPREPRNDKRFQPPVSPLCPEVSVRASSSAAPGIHAANIGTGLTPETFSQTKRRRRDAAEHAGKITVRVIWSEGRLMLAPFAGGSGTIVGYPVRVTRNRSRKKPLSGNIEYPYTKCRRTDVPGEIDFVRDMGRGNAEFVESRR